jgi:hypothetical protein
VLVSAPVKDAADPVLNIVYGVNHDKYDPTVDHIVTAASCTTNCLAPVVNVIQSKLGIVRGSITTIHNVTNTQARSVTASPRRSPHDRVGDVRVDPRGLFYPRARLSARRVPPSLAGFIDPDARASTPARLSTPRLTPLNARPDVPFARAVDAPQTPRRPSWTPRTRRRATCAERGRVS